MYNPCKNPFTLTEKHTCAYKIKIYKSKTKKMRDQKYKTENSKLYSSKNESEMQYNVSNLSTTALVNDTSINYSEHLLKSPTQHKEIVSYKSPIQDEKNLPRIKYNLNNLKEHTGDVSLCQWNNEILATGSSDSTVRILKMENKFHNTNLTKKLQH